MIRHQSSFSEIKRQPNTTQQVASLLTAAEKKHTVTRDKTNNGLKMEKEIVNEIEGIV